MAKVQLLDSFLKWTKPELNCRRNIINENYFQNLYCDMIYNYKIAMNNKTFDDTEENFVFDSKMSLPDAI